MPPPDLAGALADAVRRLETAGVPEARANAEWILAAALKCGRGELSLRRGALTARQSHHLHELLKKRCGRVPLAYVLGSQNFLGLEIAVHEGVLIPRPETEELVLEAERRLKVQRAPDVCKESGRGDAMNRRLQVLEIGTGSGCVSIALAHRVPGALIHATDISPAALALAQKNAETHRVGSRVRFLREDLFNPGAKVPRWADLVVSNPPYIPTGELPGLAPEVLKEPRLALDGGKDGLGALRAVVAQAPRHLRPGGWLILEIGASQGEAVLGLLKDARLAERCLRRDLQGLDRIASGKMIE